MITHKTLQKKYYTTHDLSVMFQLNESTIKRWADAGKLRCYKTPGGHRKFSSDSVKEFIEHYRFEPSNSHLDIFPHLTKRDITALLQTHQQDFSALFLERAFQADVESLVRILHNRFSANVSAESIYDTIVAKVVREIFSQREANKISEAEKHVASTAIFESLLQFRMITEKKPFNGKIALCGSVTNGLREVILFGLSHLLELEGWKVYNLGANTPHDVLLNGITTYKPSLVCTSWEYLSSDVLHESRLTIEDFTGMLGNCKLVAFDFFNLLDRMTEEWYEARNIGLVSSFRELKSHTSEILNPKS
jgi:excisionase family DNA binding protein